MSMKSRFMSFVMGLKDRFVESRVGGFIIEKIGKAGRFIVRNAKRIISAAANEFNENPLATVAKGIKAIATIALGYMVGKKLINVERVEEGNKSSAFEVAHKKSKKNKTSDKKKKKHKKDKLKSMEDSIKDNIDSEREEDQEVIEFERIVNQSEKKTRVASEKSVEPEEYDEYVGSGLRAARRIEESARMTLAKFGKNLDDEDYDDLKFHDKKKHSKKKSNKGKKKFKRVA